MYGVHCLVFFCLGQNYFVQIEYLTEEMFVSPQSFRLYLLGSFKCRDEILFPASKEIPFHSILRLGRCVCVLYTLRMSHNKKKTILHQKRVEIDE